MFYTATVRVLVVGREIIFPTLFQIHTVPVPSLNLLGHELGESVSVWVKNRSGRKRWPLNSPLTPASQTAVVSTSLVTTPTSQTALVSSFSFDLAHRFQKLGTTATTGEWSESRKEKVFIICLKLFGSGTGKEEGRRQTSSCRFIQIQAEKYRISIKLQASRRLFFFRIRRTVYRLTLSLIVVVNDEISLQSSPMTADDSLACWNISEHLGLPITKQYGMYWHWHQWYVRT